MQSIPNHIAIIPDGNRRWAKKHGLNPWEGHAEGQKRFEEVLDTALKSGLGHLTFWAASGDNLRKRNSLEVSFLAKLAKEELENQMNSDVFVKNEIQVKVLGSWNEILQDKKLFNLIAEFESRTKDFSKHFLTILFGYDGRDEMREGIKKLIAAKNNNISDDDIKSSLATGYLPPVDLVIRTGGEPHWSAGFMMWLTANSQFYFTEKLWPEFTEAELKTALEDYAQRERRFGK